MSVDLLLTVGVLGIVFVLLMTDVLSADAVLLGGLVVVVLGGVIDLERALQGFGNSTLLALGSLYVVAAGLRETGALDIASSYVLGKAKSTRRLLLRMCPAVTLYSAFLNNTPVVAMGVPAIRGWCRRHGVSPSKLLMPLSFAAILGGICTLIGGTSTNLVVHGLLQSHGMEGLGFFELAWVGVPCAIVGLLYIIFVAPILTPERADIRVEEEEERAQLIEVELAPDSPLVGETLDEADLKLLPGLTLVRIDRGTKQIAPVRADETLRAGDRLLFTTSDLAEEDGTEPQIDAADLEPASDEGGEEMKDTERVETVRGRELGLSAFPGLRLACTDVERDQDRELHQVVVREGSSRGHSARRMGTLGRGRAAHELRHAAPPHGPDRGQGVNGADALAFWEQPAYRPKHPSEPRSRVRWIRKNPLADPCFSVFIRGPVSVVRGRLLSGYFCRRPLPQSKCAPTSAPRICNVHPAGSRPSCIPAPQCSAYWCVRMLLNVCLLFSSNCLCPPRA